MNKHIFVPGIIKFVESNNPAHWVELYDLVKGHMNSIELDNLLITLIRDDYLRLSPGFHNYVASK